jgi:hypothetical protein
LEGRSKCPVLPEQVWGAAVGGREAPDEGGPPLPGRPPVYATLLRASESWHGVKMTSEALRQLDALRGQPAKEREKELVAAWRWSKMGGPTPFNLQEKWDLTTGSELHRLPEEVYNVKASQEYAFD